MNNRVVVVLIILISMLVGSSYVEAEVLNVVPRILAGSDIEIEYLGRHIPIENEEDTVVNNHTIRITDKVDSTRGLNWVNYAAIENSPFIREPESFSCMLDFVILPEGRRRNAMIILDNRTPVMGPPNGLNFSYRLSFFAGQNRIQFLQLLDGAVVKEWEMGYDIKVNEVYSLLVTLADSSPLGCHFTVVKTASNPLSVSWEQEVVATVFFDSIGFDAPWGAYFNLGVGSNKSGAEFRNAEIKFHYK